jgi:hypothetical protein
MADCKHRNEPDRSLEGTRKQYTHTKIHEVPKLWGAPPAGGGHYWYSWGASCLYEGHVYFERNTGTSQVCILVDTLLG